MAKKLSIVLVALAASLCLAFGIAGCTGDSNRGNIDDTEQTNTSDEQGSTDSETDDGEEEEIQTVPTEGFEYTLSDSGTYYILSGIGTVTESKVLIPSTYQGLPVCAIGDKVFVTNSTLTSVVIPDSITSIGSAAFSGCSSLKTLVIGEGVEDLAENAFYYCTALKNIYYNATACNDLSSNNGVFYNAGQNGEGITVTIGANVTNIPAYLFCPSDKSSYSPNIVNIVFEDDGKLVSIGDYSFNNCLTSFESICIPDSVTSIGSAAFGGCSSLQSITLPFVGGSSSATTASSSTLFGYIFGTSSYDGSVATMQYYDSGSYETYYIPSSLVSVTITGGKILYGAFYNCTSLESVTIGSSVTYIGYYAFYNCTSLTSATFENTSGWYANGFWIASSTLSDTATAATYLKDKYCTGYFERR